MRMFDNARAYLTQENAIKKLDREINRDEYRWIVAVNSDGKFVPVVLGCLDGQAYAHLAGRGICVSG